MHQPMLNFFFFFFWHGFALQSIIAVGWILSFMALFMVIFSVHIHENYVAMGREVTALYNALSKPFWGLGIGWVIFACSTGYGGTWLIFTLSSKRKDVWCQNINVRHSVCAVIPTLATKMVMVRTQILQKTHKTHFVLKKGILTNVYPSFTISWKAC